MSKKSKRQVRKAVSQVPAEAVDENIIISKQSSFNPDYSFVKKDLRRVGILAGSFVLILVALSFFVH